MPQKLIPTLFIFIAPPAVAFVSYFRMSSGSIDMVSMFLYFVALITLFLLLFMVKKYDKSEFFISWWAYTFPLAAITIATIMLNMAFHNALLYYGAFALLLLSTGVVGFVAYKTVEACRSQKICIEEVE